MEKNSIQMRLMQVFSVLLFLGMGSLYAQDLTFTDFDKDQDGVIQKEEFKEVFTKNYWDDWNEKDDEGLDDEDFYLFTFDIIDADDDDYVSAEEWMLGYNAYYKDYVNEDMRMYDKDKDEQLTYQEYTNAVYETNFFHDWDFNSDEFLSQKELAKAVFKNWDTDNNGVINQKEFMKFDARYNEL